LAAVQPVVVAAVVVVVTADVVVALVTRVVVTLVAVEEPLPPPDEAPVVNLTVTTLWAGMDTATAPPERLAVVVTKLLPWLVSQAEAAPGVKPVNDTEADWADDPLLVKTTTTEPSVFRKAPVTTLVRVPEVPTRTAPGRM
jgi:hypothetical protein